MATHRDAGQPGSLPTVNVFSLWCKDVLDFLGPVAAFNHTAASVVLCSPAAVTVLPQVAYCGPTEHVYLMQNPIFFRQDKLSHIKKKISQRYS